MNGKDAIQLLGQSPCRYRGVEALPSIKMLLISGTQYQCRNEKVLSGPACVRSRSSALPEATQAILPHSTFTTRPLLRPLPRVVGLRFLLVP